MQVAGTWCSEPGTGGGPEPGTGGGVGGRFVFGEARTAMIGRGGRENRRTDHGGDGMEGEPTRAVRGGGRGSRRIHNERRLDRGGEGKRKQPTVMVGEGGRGN